MGDMTSIVTMTLKPNFGNFVFTIKFKGETMTAMLLLLFNIKSTEIAFTLGLQRKNLHQKHTSSKSKMYQEGLDIDEVDSLL